MHICIICRYGNVLEMCTWDIPMLKWRFIIILNYHTYLQISYDNIDASFIYGHHWLADILYYLQLIAGLKI